MEEILKKLKEVILARLDGTTAENAMATTVNLLAQYDSLIATKAALESFEQEKKILDAKFKATNGGNTNVGVN